MAFISNRAILNEAIVWNADEAFQGHEIARMVIYRKIKEQTGYSSRDIDKFKKVVEELRLLELAYDIYQFYNNLNMLVDAGYLEEVDVYPGGVKAIGFRKTGKVTMDIIETIPDDLSKE